MIIEIDEDGQLTIDGVDRFCPFDNTLPEERQAYCGIWCPHFSVKVHQRFNLVELDLCQSKKYMAHTDDFIDRRTGLPVEPRLKK